MNDIIQAKNSSYLQRKNLYHHFQKTKKKSSKKSKKGSSSDRGFQTTN